MLSSTSSPTSDTNDCSSILTSDQIEEFCRDGVLVVHDFLSSDEIQAYNAALNDSLASHGINVNDLSTTGNRLATLSSTNGSGGVLDVFYDQWKLELAVNAKLFRVTSQLWEQTLFHHGQEEPDRDDDDNYYKWHPFGPFDVCHGYMYVDRIGYRLPTQLARQLGASKKKPLQRSLTPHLDCCPEDLWGANHNNKWRPIQCFVALQGDTVLANRGGLEVARGFHRNFHQWAAARNSSGGEETEPSLCRGAYTHMRPREDMEVMDRVQHVPVPVGSLVFWDHRIPHANAYRHDGTEPRAVVYVSFLPDVALNRAYVRRQLEQWRSQQHPTDQWVREGSSSTHAICRPEDVLATPLARRLGGLEPWC